jgi:hypothetical protein
VSQQELLHHLAQSLEDAGIAFMVVGSHSSSVHSHPRTTNDVDLVIDPTPGQLEGFLSLLGERYYVSAESAREALSRRSMFNIIDLDTGWKADLIVRKDRPFSVEEFGRRQAQVVGGRALPVASAEDVILTKLEWDRITPSERQLRDALSVAVVQWPRLDRAYLRRWAADLGVAEKLEEILRSAEEQQPSRTDPS